MKFWKHSLIAAAAFFSISSVVLYSSCTVDSCETLICYNGGTCVDGFCRCPTGYEGTQCEVNAVVKLLGKYDGITQYNSEPVKIDSAVIKYAENSVDTTRTVVSVGIYSRDVNDKFYTSLTGNEFVVQQVAGKTITAKIIGENKIEVLIEEVVDGKSRTCNFSGTKR